MGVADDLDLDVTATLDERLDEHRAVTERRVCLTGRGCHRVGKLTRLPHDSHAAPATTGRRLDQDRVVERRRKAVWCDLDDRGRGHPGFERHPLGGDLVAEQTDLVGSRADPHQSGVDHRLCEVGVLGEEAVAGMDGVAAALERGADDCITAEIRLGRRRATDGDGDIDGLGVDAVAIAVGVDPDGGDAHRPRCAGDARHDLAAVGDHQALQHQCLHTPYSVAPRTTFE